MGVVLPLQEQVRSMGMLLDSQLSPENQVIVVVRTPFAHLWLVRQLQPYLNQSDLTIEVHALVTSKLDYCNGLCVGLVLKMVRKLQIVWNAAASDQS